MGTHHHSNKPLPSAEALPPACLLFFLLRTVSGTPTLSADFECTVWGCWLWALGCEGVAVMCNSH